MNPVCPARPLRAYRLPGVQIIEAVRWSPEGDAVRIIDQRLLPNEFVERDLRTLDEVCDAIRTLAVRGAPAIGVAGAMGIVAVLAPQAREARDAFVARAREVAATIRATRPTALRERSAVAPGGTGLADRAGPRGCGQSPSSFTNRSDPSL